LHEYDAPIQFRKERDSD